MKQVTIPAQWLQELIALCGPEDHELRERVMKSAAPAPVDALATGGQAQAVEQEPFGYFKAEPFGWTDCGPDDEGAVALYERPQAKADAPAPADPSETIKSLPRYTVGRSALDGSMHTFQTEDGPFLRVNEVLAAFAAPKEGAQHAR